MRLVVDASVALKWVIPEAGSGEADLLLAGPELLAPDLIFAELANALWKAVRRGEISREEAGIAAETLEKATLQSVPSRGLLPAAVRLAAALDHPAYDCVYLALAQSEAAPLVTADERLAAKAGPRFAEAAPRVLRLAEAAALVGSTG